MQATGRRGQTCPYSATSPHFGGGSVPLLTVAMQRKICAESGRPGHSHHNTEKRQGVLLNALAVLAPHANVILTGDQYEKI